ncbi:LytS/YehU family sensor histidine kinase [Scopulibacillus daqui]|uniref:LytS/YehU family sensor histidine kinase n=1 Tax=Scopulibacillus daqui TaxID=1469162 RepID=A0ABS2PUX7_9BACL|nr:tryptophan transporter [Scopulibacillus daqui]MBM7643820.1 LytS/YehU family sensor histidine kinase [Scopulibacillus daqui]
MKLHKLLLIAIFLGIGTIFHTLIPGIIFGMKPDMLLTMMFIAIFLFADRSNIFIVGLAAGILSGFTSTIPGGFIPNIIDKLITSLVIFALYCLLIRMMKHKAAALVSTAAGTAVSGAVFLSALTVLGALPVKTSFMAMFIAAVLPAVVINTIFAAIIYPIIVKIMRQSRKSLLATHIAKRG